MTTGNPTPQSNKTTSKPNPKNKLYQVLLVVIVILLALTYFAKSQLTVATVNGQAISRLELISLLEKQGGKQVLDSLITEKLIAQEAVKQGISASQEEIDAKISTIETQLSSQSQTLDDALAMQSMTRDDLVNQIKLQLLVEKMASAESTVSAEEVDAYLEVNKNSLPEGFNIEDMRQQIEESIKSDKTNQGITAWLNNLKAQADIKYIKEY